MTAKLIQKAVGPWPMNAYVVICEATQTSAIIDPGADAETILATAQGTRIDKILLTHGHGDHIMALDEIRQASGAPVYLHPQDAERFGIEYDLPLQGGESLQLGNLNLRIIHTPGHTPGQCCFDLGDGRVVVGDTVFVGGPGRTNSPADFGTTMQTMQQIVFRWPDETRFFPGHGPSGTIGEERPAFEAFVARGWPPDLMGDVAWLKA